MHSDVDAPAAMVSQAMWAAVVGTVARGHDEAGAALRANRQAAVMRDGMRSACGQLHANLVAAALLWTMSPVPPFRAAAVPDVPHPLRLGDLEEFGSLCVLD